MDIYPTESLQRLKNLQKRTQEFSAKNSKKKKIQIIAVSKTHREKSLTPFLTYGHRHFGENRFGEAREKFGSGNLHSALLNKKIFLHFLGPLQSGNARQIPRIFQYVHGVGGWSELAMLEKAVKKRSLSDDRCIQPIRYFLQLQLSQESTKVNGFSPKEIENSKGFPSNDAIVFQGFMTMGSSNDKNQTAEIFHRAKELRDTLTPEADLSMGMTEDWELALQYDTNWLRVGSYLFENRETRNGKQAD